MFVYTNRFRLFWWFVFMFGLVSCSAHSGGAFRFHLCLLSIRVARCAVVRVRVLFVVCLFLLCLFACNRSASPPGGNQVDGLPPALGL